MKAKVFTFWSGVAAAGVAVAWTCRHAGLSDLGSAVLQWFGVVAALINAGAWQSARQLDAVPTKDLTPAGAERLRRTYGHRRHSFRRRWWLAVGSGVMVSLIGIVLKANAYPRAERWLFYGGFIALALSVALGVIISVENRRLAELARELPVQLEKERRRQETQRRLRGPELIAPEAASVAGIGSGELRRN